MYTFEQFDNADTLVRNSISYYAATRCGPELYYEHISFNCGLAVETAQIIWDLLWEKRGLVVEYAMVRRLQNLYTRQRKTDDKVDKLIELYKELIDTLKVNADNKDEVEE